MEQNGTEIYIPILPANQLRALESLLSGSTITEAALQAGVERGSVHRWMKTDYDFMAMLNQGRQDLQTSYQARLEKLAGSAIATVEKAVAGGDVKAALGVLKGLGFLSGQKSEVGSTRPGTLEREYVEEVAHDLKRIGWASRDFQLVYGSVGDEEEEEDEELEA